MNSIHDMGGITNFGPVRPEANEPVFHEDWERRMFALFVASSAYIGPIFRYTLERINAVEYLTTSYYEHWLIGITSRFEELGYVSTEELATGRAIGSTQIPFPAPDADVLVRRARSGAPASRDTGAEPAFPIGSKVRARNLETRGHTRLARYVRGKAGTVIACHGCHVFPDTYAHGLGENPQPLYTVRFEAKELWGENVTRRDCVHIDLWESYLEPALRHGEKR